MTIEEAVKLLKQAYERKHEGITWTYAEAIRLVLADRKRLCAALAAAREELRL